MPEIPPSSLGKDEWKSCVHILPSIAYVHPENVLLDWTDDVDALWIETLQTLEDSGELTEDDNADALNFLDADPLYLFGIADPVTQKALEKVATVPMLKCMGQR